MHIHVPDENICVQRQYSKVVIFYIIYGKWNSDVNFIDEKIFPFWQAEPGLEAEPGYSPKHNAGGMSIWDYIDRHHKRSAVFYNFNYNPSEHDVVIIFRICNCPGSEWSIAKKTGLSH